MYNKAKPISPVILGTDKIEEDLSVSPEFAEYRQKWASNPHDFVYGDFPLHLDIELTNRCNFNCVMCPRRGMVRKKGDMDFDLFKKIISEGSEKGLCAVNLNLLGESLLYKELERAILYCKEKKLLDVHLHTNAMLLNDKIATKLVDSGLDSITISVDAASKETYEKIRIGGNFENVRNNIISLINIRNELGSLTPKVKINLIEMQETTDEIEESLKFWKPRANKIAILRYIYFGLGKNSSVYNIIKRKKFSCPFLWQKLSIHWDGSIPICFRSSSSYDNIIGNVMDSSIEDIWKNKIMNEWRDIHKQGGFATIPLCNECHVPQEEMSKYIVRDK